MRNIGTRYGPFESAEREWEERKSALHQKCSTALVLALTLFWTEAGAERNFLSNGIHAAFQAKRLLFKGSLSSIAVSRILGVDH